jgi:methylenetetrahydrofolate reductase (NADPH)
MKVTEKFLPDQTTLSFEFFPPKTLEQEPHLFEVIEQLKDFRPDFASVTYGAMGATREKTFYWAKELKQDFGIEPVAHLTCVAATKEDIRQQLDELASYGVENILALRGDPPEGQKEFVPPPAGFHYAKELIAFIRNYNPSFSLGVAGFPEGHPLAPSLLDDTRYLKEKIEAGAEYVISQLFFDNAYFFQFLERCQKAGIKVPIIAGIMPITSLKQIKKMTEVCGASVPPKLLAELEKNEHNRKAIEEIGVEQALKQCQELIKTKVSGLHFFVMNQAGPISKILKQLTSFRR